MHLLINIIGFQIGWFACVLGAANYVPLVGPIVVAVVVSFHLSQASRPLRELMLGCAAGLMGAVWDSALVTAGLLEYPSGNFLTGFAPFWIITMWMLLATTLNVSLRWLRKRTIFAAVLGCFFGPLAFYAGSEFGGVIFVDQIVGLIVLALGWAVIMPALSVLSARLDGMAVVAASEVGWV